jgi:hypothetical protein
MFPQEQFDWQLSRDISGKHSGAKRILKRIPTFQAERQSSSPSAQLPLSFSRKNRILPSKHPSLDGMERGSLKERALQKRGGNNMPISANALEVHIRTFYRKIGLFGGAPGLFFLNATQFPDSK